VQICSNADGECHNQPEIEMDLTNTLEGDFDVIVFIIKRISVSKYKAMTVLKGISSGNKPSQ
jgi:hypothetical protein